MLDGWGPAADAALDYRRERLLADLRTARRTDDRRRAALREVHGRTTDLARRSLDLLGHVTSGSVAGPALGRGPGLAA